MDETITYDCYTYNSREVSVTEDCNRNEGVNVCFCFKDMCNGTNRIKSQSLVVSVFVVVCASCLNRMLRVLT